MPHDLLCCCDEPVDRVNDLGPALFVVHVRARDGRHIGTEIGFDSKARRLEWAVDLPTQIAVVDESLQVVRVMPPRVADRSISQVLETLNGEMISEIEIVHANRMPDPSGRRNGSYALVPPHDHKSEEAPSGEQEEPTGHRVGGLRASRKETGRASADRHYVPRFGGLSLVHLVGGCG